MILGGPASGTTRALLAGVSDSDGGGRVRGDDRPLHLDADTGDTVSAHNRIVREGASVDGTVTRARPVARTPLSIYVLTGSTGN